MARHIAKYLVACEFLLLSVSLCKFVRAKRSQHACRKTQASVASIQRQVWGQREFHTTPDTGSLFVALPHQPRCGRSRAMKISIELEIQPDELPLATELLATLRWGGPTCKILSRTNACTPMRGNTRLWRVHRRCAQGSDAACDGEGAIGRSCCLGHPECDTTLSSSSAAGSAGASSARGPCSACCTCRRASHQPGRDAGITAGRAGGPKQAGLGAHACLLYAWGYNVHA